MRKLLLAILLLCVISFAIYKGSQSVATSYYEVTSDRIPASFDSYKIVQLSDLHDAVFGENHADVVSEVEKIAPQAIFLTGDLIDSNRYNLEQSLLLVEEIQHVAPIYYVTGNHEISTNDVVKIKGSLEKLGVYVLSDEAKIINSKENESIAIGGVEDPLSSNLNDEETMSNSVTRAFEDVPIELFKLLLSHRPEQFNVYVENKIDVTFSGHAHGGQFRLPGIGGLIAPGQGLFPKLTSGVHVKEGSHLVISRGLGNSLVPIRLFNRPEIVVVTLRNE